MRRVALKHLAITPATYWRLTPAELAEMMEGAHWRRTQEWELAAWVTANLMNISGKVTKKRITPDKLLGKRPKPQFHEPRDYRADVEELLRRQREIDARTAN